MSRIHEALQRADRERKSIGKAKVDTSAKPQLAAETEGNLATLNPIDIESIAARPWNPLTNSLPTLGDRTETIEQFRTLRSRLYEFRIQEPLKTIVVSSGMSGEGKTFVAANLAVSLARNKNQHVVIIDADMRRPTLHTIFGTSPTPGLSEYLTGAAELKDVIQRHRHLAPNGGEQVEQAPLPFFIPAGNRSDCSSELIASQRVEELISALSSLFDWIVIDSPPVQMFADAVDIARAADGVLLVARSATTPFEVAEQAQAAFRSSRILGFVLNAVRNPPNTRSYYNYYGR